MGSEMKSLRHQLIMWLIGKTPYMVNCYFDSPVVINGHKTENGHFINNTFAGGSGVICWTGGGNRIDVSIADSKGELVNGCKNNG